MIQLPKLEQKTIHRYAGQNAWKDDDDNVYERRSGDAVLCECVGVFSFVVLVISVLALAVRGAIEVLK